MLRAPKTVLDSVFNADSIFDIFKILKISYFFKLKISKSKVSKIFRISFFKKTLILKFVYLYDFLNKHFKRLNTANLDK